MKMQIQKLEEGKSPSPISTFAALVDGVPEAIPCNTVEIEALYYERQRGSLHVVLQFGGYDSKGVFHEDPNYSKTPKGVIWNKDQHAELWNYLDLDHLLETHAASLAEKILEWFHQGDALTSIGRDLLRLPVMIASQVTDNTGKVTAPIKVALLVKDVYIKEEPIGKTL